MEAKSAHLWNTYRVGFVRSPHFPGWTPPPLPAPPPPSAQPPAQAGRCSIGHIRRLAHLSPVDSLLFTVCAASTGCPPPLQSAARWGACTPVRRCGACSLCGEEAVPAEVQRRCGGGRVDVGRGYGRGCFAGSPWREAQQSLMLSTSEREREGGGTEGERKTEMRNEREKGYLWISQPSAQEGGGGWCGGRGVGSRMGASVVLEGEGKWALM